MRSISLMARLGVGIVFAIAAGAKAASPDQILRTIDWIGVPHGYATLCLTLLIVAEAVLAIALLSVPSSAWARGIAIGTLSLFTALLVLMVLSKEAPSCGCLGLLYEFRSARNELLFGIARNFLLCAALLWNPSQQRVRVGESAGIAT